MTMHNRRQLSSQLALLLVVGAVAAATTQAQDEFDKKQLPAHRVFASSRFSMDDVLTRSYDPDVPMGCVGDRVWASSPQGWAFRDDVHWLYLTNLKAFDIEIRDEHGLLQPAKATYFPSHVHMEGATRAVVASASFTFTTDNAQNPLTKPFRQEKRWTCWSSGKRDDWYAVDLGTKLLLSGLNVFFFDDAPGGGCRPPTSFEVERWDADAGWKRVATKQRKPDQPQKGDNLVAFEPIETDRVRLVFRNAGDNFYTGLYGFEPILTGDRAETGAATPLRITADKFITHDDVLVSVVRVHNPTTEPQSIQVLPLLDWTWTGEVELRREYSHDIAGKNANGQGSLMSLWFSANTRLHDIDVRRSFRFAAMSDPPAAMRQGGEQSLKGEVSITPLVEYLRVGKGDAHVVPPLGTKVFKAALELKLPNEPTALDRVLIPVQGDGGNRIEPDRHDARDLVAIQVAEYQKWFDSNLAYFDCSDPWITKMYYHRAYILRKNSLDPKLGRMQWKTQAEGRWRSGWYPNVISYGGGHQVREARWLRDTSYSHGHVRTFADNEKADGVYPSHVKPSGPAGGQYTDWITAAAWDAHVVHPDREFLVAVADKLAANVRGWQKVYDPDGDGLLLVDSHWWTGMEYQPSFFFFSDFKPAKNFYEPENKVSLDRVDLTAYNFGNAVAVARIYREIGQPEKTKEFDDLASKIAAAVRAKMWDAHEKFFYSLKHDDGAKADVKEVIGVYPFYFGMLPAASSERYEAAWESIIDPDQFWTPWPVASASKKCPAYSQSNWPGDGRAAGCMWNGPTWPHANSIVLTAMARTLRGSREWEVGRRKSGNERVRRSASDALRSTLDAQHLWSLFLSFTKAQFRDQNLSNPWTGEFYNGETAKWKTAERDYNHSTWLDVLIPDLIGLVPRSDEVLEIDPLVPPGKLSHFLLDGQHYRGHDVTIVWDDPAADGIGDVYGDGRRGLDVYLDGKRVASADTLARLFVNLKTGKPVN